MPSVMDCHNETADSRKRKFDTMNEFGREFSSLQPNAPKRTKTGPPDGVNAAVANIRVQQNRVLSVPQARQILIKHSEGTYGSKIQVATGQDTISENSGVEAQLEKNG